MLLEAGRRIRSGADYVIMGHRHRPRLQSLETGVYVNLGDWITNFTYAVYEQGELKMFTLRNDEFEVADL
jgi:UDP-2,3-diacylglucosamine hydrolase